MLKFINRNKNDECEDIFNMRSITGSTHLKSTMNNRGNLYDTPSYNKTLKKCKDIFAKNKKIKQTSANYIYKLERTATDKFSLQKSKILQEKQKHKKITDEAESTRSMLSKSNRYFDNSFQKYMTHKNLQIFLLTILIILFIKFALLYFRK
jgi:hypothetical protein